MEELQRRIPQQVFNKLIDANITDYCTLLSYNKEDLMNFVDAETAELILKETVGIVLKKKLQTVDLVAKWTRISTGCLSIDAVLRGGIPCKKITEIFGSSGVGKTQFCLQLSLMVQLPIVNGGLHKSAIYICTEDAFPSKRFNELSSVFEDKFNQTNMKDNVVLTHIREYEQLETCLCKFLPKLLDQNDVGLIVIDSIAGIFRGDNENVDYKLRKQNFNILINRLLKLSNIHNFAILIVNQVSDNLITNQTIPALGLSWSNLVTCRFLIERRSDIDLRNFSVIFAPDLPNKSSTFRITREGLV